MKYIRLSEGKKQIAQQAKQSLNNILDVGDTVYTVLRHVSTSGMSRRIDIYVMKDNKPVYLSGLYAQLREETPPKDGLVVKGCGMDMGFHVVYTLSSLLFRDTAKGDAGYCLNHAWL